MANPHRRTGESNGMLIHAAKDEINVPIALSACFPPRSAKKETKLPDDKVSTQAVADDTKYCYFELTSLSFICISGEDQSSRLLHGAKIGP